MASAEVERSDDAMRECIDNCTACHRVCLETLADCLKQGGRLAEPGHLRLLMDCADICETSARFMLRGSELHSRTCFACAEVCAACATACEKLGDAGRMKACADACRRCEESCRRMSGGVMPQPLNPEAAQRFADLPA
ncbi:MULTISPECIES: four-helix bundle copper-binding protein [unclassified Corallococcus]|uniref:four-helix bundle copper-binding protein n=1 Tax=unclassified Corallococcus TaxID=2685029 RepID=UPI001A8C3DC5|nr:MULTISPECIES: four-helix bundle copper-binding protein [unclassified Corallococcus]MBN9688279.1 four-helix bundle copper-binding protein [Corallococcus sp. NCSPR001]WAS87917.1 four-helix bundle copper-binding protein [Corallococcus sp. NCRR]